MNDKTAAFEFHGIEFTGETGNERIGTCPFCGKEQHFYVNIKTGQWDCKACPHSGNVQMFLEQIHQTHFDNTSSEDYAELKKERGLLVRTLRDAGLAKDGRNWLLPVRNAQGKMVQLRRWSPGGNFFNTAGLPAALFGLDCLQEEGRVYLCEGEWDALALRELLGKENVLGVPGAGTWKETWSTALRGRDVAVLYDNDPAGQRGATKVAQELSAVGCRVLKLEWPEDTEDADLRDFVRADGTREGLEAMLVKSAVPAVAVTAEWRTENIMNKDLPEPRWIMKGIIPQGLTILAGRPKTGKSLLAMQVARAALRSESLFGRTCAPEEVLFLALEDNLRTLKHRLHKQQWSPQDDCAWITELGEPPLNLLLQKLEESQAGLVVVDNFSCIAGGGIDQNSVSDVQTILRPLHEYTRRTDRSVIVVDHNNKANAKNPVDALLGSTGKAAIPDTIIGLYKEGRDRGILRWTGREVETGEVHLVLDGSTLSWRLATAAETVKVGSVEQAILKALEDLGRPVVVAELVEELDMDAAHVRRALNVLERKGMVLTTGKKGQAPLWVLGSVAVGGLLGELKERKKDWPL